MSIDSSQFMTVAKELIADEKNHEIALRCAGSRAYYALYHAALEALSRKGKVLVKVDKAGDHASVIATLSSMGPNAKSISVAMGVIRRFRNDCDYDLSMHVKPKKTAMKVAEAQILIDRLSRL